ncbi:TPA: PKD domain-containing protein, partial [Candidatus Poribacteria bacterium]|nr:PKD domain-containing protein [Candidatus Poribacteria bacterium]
TFVVYGTVFQVDGQAPARAGLKVVVKLNDFEVETITESGGTYQATNVVLNSSVIIATTSDVVNVGVTATDIAVSRVVGTATHKLTTAEVKVQRVEINVTTDLKVASKVLSLSGQVYLDGGKIPAPDGLAITVSNVTRNQQISDVTIDGGKYNITFLDLSNKIVVETEDELKITLTSGDGAVFEKTHAVSTGEVSAGKVEDLDVVTNFGATTKLLNVKGIVYREGGEVAGPAGLTVKVSVKGSRASQSAVTAGDGSYSLKLGNGIAFLAQTGSEVTALVSDAAGERGRGSIVLTTSAVVSGNAILNAITDLGATTDTLAVTGKVYNQGEQVIKSGLTGMVSLGNVSVTVSFEADGTYSATFVSFTGSIAESGDTVRLSFTHSDGSISAYQAKLTTKQITDQLAEVDVMTDLSVSTETLAVVGKVYDIDGQVIKSGLTGTASIGGVSVPISFEADGTYSATFFSFTGSVASSGDMVELSFVSQDGVKVLYRVELTGKQVASQLADDIDVDFIKDEGPPTAVAVAVPSTIQIGESVTFDGSGSTDDIGIVSYSWVIDGVASAVKKSTTTHTFDKAGSYTATLTVKDKAENEAVATVAVSVGGFGFAGLVREADGKILESNTATSESVLIEVTHLSTKTKVVGMPRNGRYVAVYGLDQSENISVGDQFEIRALSANGLPLSRTVMHVLAPKEYQSNMVELADIATNRTSTYAITGRIFDADIQPIVGAVVSVETPLGVQTVITDESASYSFTFSDYLTNPSRGEEILLNVSIPGGMSRRLVVIAFEEPIRAVVANSLPLLLGGLAINTVQHRDFIDRLVSHTIAETEVGRTLGNGAGELLEFVRKSPKLRSDMIQLIEGLLLGGLLPNQVVLSPELPLIFEQSETLIMENFGNGLYPYSVAGMGLGTKDENLALAVVGDKLDLYLIVPGAEATSVEFSLTGAQGSTVTAQRIVEGVSMPHTFQLEEQLGVTFLPAWPGLRKGDQQVFNSVKLKYAVKNLPVSGDRLNPVDYSREAMLQPRVISDQVVWETVVDIKPAKAYYYYYQVELSNPLVLSLGGKKVDVSNWGLPDPRNLQIEDRDLIEKLVTREFQLAVAPVLDPMVSSVFSGGGKVMSIAPQQQKKLTSILTANALPLMDDILQTLDPKVSSMFVTPKLSTSQSLWVATFDLANNIDGDYQLSASVYNTNGDLVDRIGGKKFRLDRFAPSADLSVSAGQNSRVYQAEDGVYVATALPVAKGESPLATLNLSLQHDPVNDVDLTGYIYQLIRHHDDVASQTAEFWTGVPTSPDADYTGASQVIGGLLGGLLAPGQLGIFGQQPVTATAPHRVSFMIRGEQADSALVTGKFGVRAVGVDPVLNVGSRIPPTRLNVVPAAADMARVATVIVNGQQGEDTIYADELDLKLRVSIVSRKHPLTLIRVEYVSAGNWTEIGTIEADALKGAAAGSTYDVDWKVTNFDDLLAVSSQVDVRAVATNAFGIADPKPVSLALKLDARLYPAPPAVNSIDLTATEFGNDSGGTKGEIVLVAKTKAFTKPSIGLVRFEARRQKEAENWQRIGDVKTSADASNGFLEWKLMYDTKKLGDTIVAGGPAARDRLKDDNPYIVRAVAVDVAGKAHDTVGVIKSTALSVDNVDDVPPITGTEITQIVDGMGVLKVQGGAYSTGGLIAKDVDPPVLLITAKPAADPATFNKVELHFTIGEKKLDLIPMQASNEGLYKAAVPLKDVANGKYVVRALVTDAANNVEVADDREAIRVHVENFELPFSDEKGIVIAIGDRDPQSATEIAKIYPRGVPITKGGFSFSSILPADVTEKDIDIFINGQSARARGLLKIEVKLVKPTGQGFRSMVLVDEQKEFIITLDTSQFDDGIYDLKGYISTRTGQLSFDLPKINVDTVPPVIEILSPLTNAETSPLPTIYASYNDGTIGSGIDAKTSTIKLARLAPTEKVVKLDADGLKTNENALIYTQLASLEGGFYRVIVAVSDIAGNLGETSIEFAIEGTPPKIPDNTAPVVSTFSPQGIVQFEDVLVSVTASDPESGVSGVMLSVDGKVAKEGAAQVFKLDNGTHKVKAVVTNGKGLKTTATWSFLVELKVEEVDKTPPIVSSVTPQGLVRSADVTVAVSVFDDQSGISDVQLSVNGDAAKKGSQRRVTLNSGNHAARAVVTNGVGLKTTFDWTFTVEIDTTPPQITTVSPEGIIRLGKPQISISVVDDSSGVDKIEISVVNALDLSSVPGSIELDSKKTWARLTPENVLENGTYAVNAKVSDAFGNTSGVKWVFTVEVDVKPPQIMAITPQGTIHTEKPSISASVADDISGVKSVDVLLRDSNGKGVSGKLKTDDTKSSATFTPQNNLKEGNYSVAIKATDNAGNSSSTKWSFTVILDTTPPVITIISPMGESNVSEGRPVISASYTDAISGIDQASVKLFVDNEDVTSKVKVSDTRVSYISALDLAFGRHAVKIEVSDLATPTVNTSSQEWTFMVESRDGLALLYPRNYPNPFEEATTVAFTLTRGSSVSIEIYDVTMRLVLQLKNNQYMEAGEHQIKWDGKTDGAVDDLARGVYFCQIIVESSLEPEYGLLKMALTR